MWGHLHFWATRDYWADMDFQVPWQKRWQKTPHYWRVSFYVYRIPFLLGFSDWSKWNETKLRLQDGIFADFDPWALRPLFVWWLPWAFTTMLYWWLLLTLSHSWVWGNYVVHFSSGQGLQPETTSQTPRHAVNLSVQGHRFQCQLPGVGDATGFAKLSRVFFAFLFVCFGWLFKLSLPNNYW